MSVPSPTGWCSEEEAALRTLTRAGESAAAVARALNARFGRGRSRSAVIGKAKRMKFALNPHGGARLAALPHTGVKPSRQGERGPRLRGGGEADAAGPRLRGGGETDAHPTPTPPRRAGRGRRRGRVREAPAFAGETPSHSWTRTRRDQSN